MKGKVRTLSMIALMLYSCGATATDGHPQTQTQEQQSGARVEAATYFGAMFAGKEVGRGINATGGHEQLIARLNNGVTVGLRFGVHSNVLGLEAGFLTTGNTALVTNEFGIRFPNHAENPLIYSADALAYPLRQSIRKGSVRPYVTSGFGGMLMSADLDNINDQELHNRLVWNAGGGVKLFGGGDPSLYVDVRFTNHRLFGTRNLGSVSLRSMTVGVGCRF